MAVHGAALDSSLIRRLERILENTGPTPRTMRSGVSETADYSGIPWEYPGNTQGSLLWRGRECAAHESPATSGNKRGISESGVQHTPDLVLCTRLLW